MISMIACVTRNNGIGLKGDLLVKSSKDMNRFRAKTKGKKVVMGYGTWKSLPTLSLKDRLNIVFFNGELPDDLREATENEKHTVMAIKIDEHNQHVNFITELAKEEEIVVIGGQSMYETFIPFASVLYLTYVDMTMTADRFFPYFNTASWNVTENRIVKDKINKNFQTSLTFLTLEREEPQGTPVTFFKDMTTIFSNVANTFKKSELGGISLGY